MEPPGQIPERVRTGSPADADSAGDQNPPDLAEVPREVRRPEMFGQQLAERDAHSTVAQWDVPPPGTQQVEVRRPVVVAGGRGTDVEAEGESNLSRDRPCQ